MLPWSGVNVVYLKGVVNGPDEGEGWYVLKLKKKGAAPPFSLSNYGPISSIDFVILLYSKITFKTNSIF